jgi:hypothetical protein
MVILNEEKKKRKQIAAWSFFLFSDTKWQELNQLTMDRQQKLEESSNNLTQFQTTEAQLKQWLMEKELMVSVLGPLSIDPNMLNTQKQQVQVSVARATARMWPLDVCMANVCSVNTSAQPSYWVTRLKQGFQRAASVR